MELSFRLVCFSSPDIVGSDNFSLFCCCEETTIGGGTYFSSVIPGDISSRFSSTFISFDISTFPAESSAYSSANFAALGGINNSSGNSPGTNFPVLADDIRLWIASCRFLCSSSNFLLSLASRCLRFSAIFFGKPTMPAKILYINIAGRLYPIPVAQKNHKINIPNETNILPTEPVCAKMDSNNSLDFPSKLFAQSPPMAEIGSAIAIVQPSVSKIIFAISVNFHRRNLPTPRAIRISPIIIEKYPQQITSLSAIHAPNGPIRLFTERGAGKNHSPSDKSASLYVITDRTIPSPNKISDIDARILIVLFDILNLFSYSFEFFF